MSFCVLCALLLSVGGPVGQNDPSAMAKDYQALVLELLTRLQEKGLWTDEKQKPKLLAYLDVAERMKPISLIPLLIEHLEYDVYAKEPDSRPGAVMSPPSILGKNEDFLVQNTFQFVAVWQLGCEKEAFSLIIGGC